MIGAVALLWLPLGCGITSKRTDGLVAGAPAAPDGAAGAGADAPVGCLYPASVLEPLKPDYDDVTDYQLSTPYPIDVEPEIWAGVEATYDFNGDRISDILYQKRDQPEGQRIGLVLSSSAMDFRFSEQECPDLEWLNGDRIFVRDLDQDGVGDFVVSRPSGLMGYLNHASGLVTGASASLSYGAWTDSQASFVNVETGDVDGDGLIDVVVGYNVIYEEDSSEMEIGVVLLRQQEDGWFEEVDPAFKVLHHVDGDLGRALTGNVALGYFGGDDQLGAIMALTLDPGDLERVGTITQFHSDSPARPLTVPGMRENALELFAVGPRTEHQLIGAVGAEAVYLIDAVTEPATVVATQALAFRGVGRALGQTSFFPRYYFHDIDRDGDDDFIQDAFDEANDESVIALYINLNNEGFAEPQVFPLDTACESDAPFLALGPLPAMVAQQRTGYGPASVHTLFR